MRRRWNRKLLLIFTLVFFALFSCDQFVLWEELGIKEGTSGALSLAPVSATLSANSSLTFVATGGSPSYTFSVVSGSGTIDPVTGIYTAPPGAGTDIVRVTDSAGATRDATITITSTGVLGISPSAITLAANGSVTFAATGGVSPYTFSLVSGSGSIAPATGLYNAPVTPGSAIVRVTDSDTPASTADASITVNLPVSLSISPSSMILYVNNSLDFEAFGGVTPYSFSIVAGGGSIISATGLYNAPASADNVTVRVTDSDIPPSAADATITVSAPPPDPLSINPSSISVFTNNSVGFGATGGIAPYTFAVVAGVGSVNPATGLYTAGGSAGSATVRVADSDAPASTDDATVTICAPFTIVPTSQTLTVNSTFTFSASGGKTPYTFLVVSGGGSINSTTGLYTAPAAPDTVVVRATDNLGNTSDATVAVTPAQALVINPSTKTLLVNDAFAFTASGGTSPYSFSILPPASGSINPATGLYTAPATATTETVRVTDALSATSDATVTVVGSGPLAIGPSSVTVPVNGERTFSATGGTPPYSFSIVAGGGTINATSGLYTAPSTTGAVSVRVTDSLLNTDDAAVTVSGSGCGQTYPESEPNNDKAPPWTSTDDFGIALVPGCTTTITGTSDLGGLPDVFKFNTGSAGFITFIVTWSSGGNELDIQIYDVVGNKISESHDLDLNSESHVWAVDAPGANRYLELEVKASGGVNYTLTIDAN